MDPTLPTIPLSSLLIVFVPALLLIGIMQRWSLDARHALYANGRMLVQLLAVGYVLTYVFETDQPLVIVAVVTLMVGIAAWIALRPLKDRRRSLYGCVLIAIATSANPRAASSMMIRFVGLFGNIFIQQVFLRWHWLVARRIA